MTTLDSPPMALFAEFLDAYAKGDFHFLTDDVQVALTTGYVFKPKHRWRNVKKYVIAEPERHLEGKSIKGLAFKADAINWSFPFMTKFDGCLIFRADKLLIGHATFAETEATKINLTLPDGLLSVEVAS